MQITAGKRQFDFGKARTAAFAIGIVVALAVGVATISQTGDDASPVEPAETLALPTIHPDEAFRLEQEMMSLNDLHRTSSLNDATTDELPEEAIDARVSTERLTAYDVPGAGEGIVGGNSRAAISDSGVGATHRGYEYYQFLEQNVLFGDDAQLAPPFDPVVPY